MGYWLGERHPGLDCRIDKVVFSSVPGGCADPFFGLIETGENRRGMMSGNKTGVESPAQKKPGTRKLFYGAIGLLLVGLLLVAIGAIISLPLLMLVGVAGMLGAGAVQMAWLVRKIG